MAKASHVAEPTSREEELLAFLWEGPTSYTAKGGGHGRGKRRLRQSAPDPVWYSWKHDVICVPGKGFSADEKLFFF